MKYPPACAGAVDAALCLASAAAEQAWLREALRNGVERAAVRVWLQTQPAVVLGRSGPRDLDAAVRAREAGIELHVRPSGGGAVLAGPWMISAAVVLPAAHPLVERDVAASYAWFGDAHCAWLAREGVVARPFGGIPARRDDALAWACFASLSHGEVAIDGRKMIGLAQARTRAAVLYSSGILASRPPWEVLCRVMGRPLRHARALAERTLSYADLAGPQALPDVLGRSLLETLAATVAAGRDRGSVP